MSVNVETQMNETKQINTYLAYQVVKGGIQKSESGQREKG